MDTKRLKKPSDLTNGVKFSPTSPANKCKNAAKGLMAFIYQLWNGGRSAELVRWRWSDTSITVGEDTVPVWTMGLGGVLSQLQEAKGTGFDVSSYHAKHKQAYCLPDPVPFLPAACSGLCLGACLNLCYVILTWLQPVCPSNPIPGPDGETMTTNNACGWCFPFGGLQYLRPEELEDLRNKIGVTGDGLSELVKNATSAVKISTKKVWDDIKDKGELIRQESNH